MVPDFTPVRLDREPVVWTGCTSSEIAFLMRIASLAGIITGLVLWVVTGAWPVIVALPAIFVGFSLTAGARFLASAKRGKPLNYHQQRWSQWAHHHLGTRIPFVHYSGSWNTVRHG